LELILKKTWKKPGQKTRTPQVLGRFCNIIFC